MRPFHLVCLVVLLAVRAAAGQPAPRGPAAEVLALEDTLNAAWLRHDTLSLGRLIGADFRGITASGGVGYQGRHAARRGTHRGERDGILRPDGAGLRQCRGDLPAGSPTVGGARPASRSLSSRL